MDVKIIVLSLGIATLRCGNQNDIKKKIDNLSSSEKYHVVLMAGQSNMVGQGKKENLKFMDFENVHYLNFCPLSKAMKKEKFGPETGVARNLATNFPNRRFILVKYAVNGSSMYDWAPNYSKEKAEITGQPEFGNLYDSLLNKFQQVTKELNAEPTALLWMQGERDAKIPKAGKNYYENFKRFIQSLRHDLNSPEMPILYGMVNPPKGKYPWVDSVQASQRKADTTIENTYIIETKGIEKWFDFVHYSTNGQLELGEKFGQKLVEVIKMNESETSSNP